MNNLVRFALITIVIVVAALLLLAVGGVLSSRELQDNVVKVLQVVAIVFGASALITLVTKK
jgi:FtsH-binding integral membrane protein